MLEFLTTNLLWWHWVVLGIILITMEMFTGSFMLLGLGVAAMLVGEIANLFEISLVSQLSLWIILSLLSLGIWFRYLRDQSVERSGQSDYVLDAEGVVEQSIDPNSRGAVKFDAPILGNTRWPATAKEPIAVGSRVKITQVKGQLMEVVKL